MDQFAGDKTGAGRADLAQLKLIRRARAKQAMRRSNVWPVVKRNAARARGQAALFSASSSL